ncbi:SDR family NAD(P)-dependent oxidoreductase [Streptomyces sp. NPDC059629]|uniref:SDR family NAD(P)-dependent oxidoreductase n=1 Tax=Streptomyces sp. NPDC059629 TaxID=3346889 RepID=UPI0036B89564
MTTTFITGADKSLGLETARRLVEAGHTVLLGARDRERGRAATASLGARFVRIDVTDDASVQAAAADVAAHEGTIDVLVNNAGVLGNVGPVEEYTAADMSAVLDVNVVGIVCVTHAFLPLLRKSSNPVIVNVSSGMGSFGMTQDPARIESQYALPLSSASKAAVTMLTTQYLAPLVAMPSDHGGRPCPRCRLARSNPWGTSSPRSSRPGGERRRHPLGCHRRPTPDRTILRARRTRAGPCSRLRADPQAPPRKRRAGR